MFTKIDKFVIGSFLGPFFLTQAVVVFILLVQQLIGDLKDFIGKDLGIDVFGELIFYFILHLTPVALPLAVLLASLISFGTLGEHSELTAIKSAGISLIRVIRPVFLFVIVLSCLSFWFNDRIVPQANLNAYSLLYDIRQKKPSLDLKQGAFYDGLPGYSIKVNHKYPDGKSLKEVMIYNHTKENGNSEVILADSGRMYTIKDNKYLIFELYRGVSFSDKFGTENNANSDQFLISKFKYNKMTFGLESFEMNKTDKELFSTNKIMRNVSELNHDVDSLQKLGLDMKSRAFNYIAPNHLYMMKERVLDTSFNYKLYGRWKQEEYFKSKFEDKSNLKMAYTIMGNQIRNIHTIVKSRSDIYNSVLKDINTFSIEKQRKYTSAFACFVMFLIGAPLGAIIKKGGLGVPILISITFFIIFYILSMTGEKWSKESFVPVIYGMWASNAVLTLCGLFFLRQAYFDSRLFDLDTYQIAFNNFRDKFFKKKSTGK